MILSEWINSGYLKEKKIFKNKKIFLHQKPFSHLEFKIFFNEGKARLISEALKKERFFQKESDLFKFRQTSDLKSSHNKILQEFRSFLSSTEFILFLSTITSTSLKFGKIDLSGSLYQDTDFLLCHDDMLEGRRIAFFWYLSDLEENDGGRLNLYSSKNNFPLKVEKQIIPQFNTFAFFLVSEKSFHAVEEMLSRKKRYTLSGWFYDK